jgi:hypothetical protein
VRVLSRQLSSIKDYVHGIGGDERMVEMLSHQVHEHIDQLYSDELPLSIALDKSDIVFRLEGPGISSELPSATLIAAQLMGARKQVFNVMKSISGVSSARRIRMTDVDLGVAALAKGSIVIGLVAVPSSGTATHPTNILGGEDPLLKATQRAIREIGIVTKHLGKKDFRERVAEAIPDPRVRDAAIVAVEQLSPTTQSGIESVSIASRGISPEFNTLTRDDRKYLRGIMRRPIALSKEAASYSGIVREIDLDAHRFELRKIKGLPNVSLRCAFAAEQIKDPESLVNKHLVVVGQVEKAADGMPRLMMVQSVRRVRALR